MSSETIQIPQGATKQASSLQMIATLGGVAMLSGFLIFFVYGATAAQIKLNQQNFLNNAVFAVLPGAVEQTAFAIGEDGVQAIQPGQKPQAPVVYAGYKEDGTLAGVAFEASGMSYADVVKVLVGYDPDAQKLIGFTVLASKDTPGLGDRIGKDPAFLANFDGMDVALDAAGAALAHPIEFVKNGEKDESKSWQVEGISGATISSKAVATMLEEGCEVLLPLIHKQAAALKEGQ
ncbi:MAG: FMN-binding protein [bacterium]|nr:FMN-binding protein [bacterium]